ncbi:MAG: hypothetical protein P4K83_03415 [Terracidiphilus sp.]|nr:hypothetical protein [Terracidiphilus sp.]
MPIVAATIGAVGGGIVSGLLVHWLTRSREQEAWIRNCEKEEWRELLSVLTKAEEALSRLALAYHVNPEDQTPAELQAFSDATEEAFRTMDDRLFIYEPLNTKDKLAMQWLRTHNEQMRGLDDHESLTEDSIALWRAKFYDLKDKMRTLALASFKKESFLQRLQFWKD